MIYTAVIKESGSDYRLSICEGTDWWSARDQLSAKKDLVVAMIPGEHRRSLVFTNDGLAVRCLDSNHPPMQGPNGG